MELYNANVYRKKVAFFFFFWLHGMYAYFGLCFNLYLDLDMKDMFPYNIASFVFVNT